MRTLPKVASVLVLALAAATAASCAQWERVPAEERREIVDDVSKRVEETIKAKPADRDWAGLIISIVTAVGGALVGVRAMRGPATPEVNQAVAARTRAAAMTAAAKG